jgi:CRP/FNR family cyclic AMP-dependent transcriptional regulator
MDTSSNMTINLPKKLLQYFSTGSSIVYKKGEVLIRPQDEPNDVFLVTNGYVKAYAITKYGEENLLLVRGAGSIFPLIWAFTGLHREITYEAMDTTTVWRRNKNDYREFLDNNQDVLPAILEMAIEAYRLHAERVNTLSYRSARERVVSFLITIADRFGIEQPNGDIVIDAPLRRHDIANSVNTARETVSRELIWLTEHGYIAADDDRNIVIKNLPELELML